MNNSQSFDFAALKNMSVDKLIEKCKGYIEQYVSPNAGAQFGQAYQNENYDKVMQLLAEAKKKIEAGVKRADLKKTQDIITQEFPEAKVLFDDTVRNGGRQSNSMIELSSEIGSKISGGTIVLIVILVAMLVIMTIKVINYWNKSKIIVNKKTVKEMLPKYTEKDSDMLELIHQLSIIYQTTDEYLKG